jgi:hypothetical protein
METNEVAGNRNLAPGDRSALSKSSRQTLDLLFAHPLARNLEWTDIAALFEKLGTVEHTANNESSIRVGTVTQKMRRPHGKDLTAEEVMELRHFLTRVGWSIRQPLAPREAADMLLTIAHHEARLYHMDLRPTDPADQVIKPYDPHHFLHHLAHKSQTREHGQRAAEDPSFYDRISQALAAAAPHGRIVVVGHGKGHSDAAHHFIEWVHLHHPETAHRLVGEVVADLSAITPPQLLALGRAALSPVG